METLCQLCSKAPPIKNSHVVPEFLYKPVYDGKHRFMPYSTDAFSPPSIEQLGFREPLLCTTCEGRFSVWEGKLKEMVDALITPPAHGMSVIHDAGNILIYDNVDYSAVKRAVLSIQWRMSIAKREPWQAYALGSLEENLRLALLGDAHIPCYAWPTTLSVIMHDGQTVPSLMLLYKEPTVLDGLLGHTFLAHGIMFTTYLTEKDFPMKLCGGVLNETGYLPVPKIPLSEVAQDLEVDMRNDFNARTRKFHGKA